VQETVARVLHREHVALIGPGGIGKTSISKAIIHDERIVQYFKNHRYFATYDGVANSMMTHTTFLTRLATALLIDDASLSTIRAKLLASPTLLVIDNAETFLDAASDDGDAISVDIEDLGACSSVHLIITTRNENLPNLSWCRQDVGGLGMEASRATFKAVYKLEDIGNRLDSLFSSLDHHALSISLLSHAATQNRYRTTDRIIKAWEQQQTRLLQRGKGKSQNLAFTIELSLNSPSLQAAKTQVFAFLRIVAFLPEGLHEDDLSGVSSDDTDIQTIVDTVCLSSLTYRSGDRFTMLAPIRMYIMDQYNANLTYQDPVLVSVRNYAYQQVSDDPEFWGVRESANTERLLSFDLISKHVQHDYNACLRTLRSVQGLCTVFYVYHPRETSLFPLLQAVSVTYPTLQAELIVAKAQCLIGICWLQHQIRRDFIKNDMLGTAESFCRRHTPTCTEQLVSCLRLKGMQYQQNGNLFMADEAIREASTLAHSMNDRSHVAALNHNLSVILFLRGNISEATSLMASAEEYFRSNNQHLHLVALLLDWIDVLVYEKDFETAREIVGQAEELDRIHNGGRRSCELLNKKADIEAWAGNVTAAMKVLDEATRDEMHPGMPEFDRNTEAWRAKACYAATVGNFDNARVFLVQAVELESETGRRYVTDNLLAASIELYSGELGRAKELLGTMLKEDGQDDIQLTGFIHRALGEVVLLLGDKDDAMSHFGQIESMCSTSGMAPKLLYANLPHWYSLSAKYDGWIRFLDRTL